MEGRGVGGGLKQLDVGRGALGDLQWDDKGWVGLKVNASHTHSEVNKLWNDWIQLWRDLCFKGEDCLLTKYQKSAQSKRSWRLILKLHLET